MCFWIYRNQTRSDIFCKGKFKSNSLDDKEFEFLEIKQNKGHGKRFGNQVPNRFNSSQKNWRDDKGKQVDRDEGSSQGSHYNKSKKTHKPMSKDHQEVLLNEKEIKPSQYGTTNESLWYLDNGASNHMTGNKEHFKELDKKVSGRVRFGDGSFVEIEGKGSILLECKNKEQRIISHVYYIPNLKNNILSLGQLTENGCKVLLERDLLFLYDNNETLLMKVTRSKNRLYNINLRIGAPICLLSKIDEEAWLWYARLGHLNFDTIKLMTHKNMVQGVPRINHASQICDACLLGKHIRAPFPNQARFKSDKPLELVYGYLCGPISPPTHSGKKYIFLLVDDYTRYMWIYLLSSKDQAFGIFREFKKLVENEVGTKLKTLRTDRGGEFNSSEFNSFCKEHGIARQLTTPYTPQQNGVVESRNRTMLSTTRSTMKAMSMPQNFWGEDVRHTIYVLNRTPTKALKNSTPFEALKGRKPNLKHVGTKEPDWVKFIVEEKVLQENNEMVPMTHGDEQETDDNQEPLSPSSPNNTVTPPTCTHEQSSAGDAECSDILSNPFDHTPVQGFKPLAKVYEKAPKIDLNVNKLLIAEEEPQNYKEAAKDKKWVEAMQAELNSINKNNTWTLTKLPSNHKAIGLKWVFKTKRDANGEIIKHKARLVAKGYVQQHGIDFDEVFAPVARIETVPLILALAAYHGWEVHHLDVKSAFLHGELKEEVYVSQPEGFVKDAGKAVYTKKNKTSTLLIGVCVDDLIVTGTQKKEIDLFKSQMEEKFEMSDLGLLAFYLGIEVIQTKDEIAIKQSAYITKILKNAGMLNSNETKIPMNPGTLLTKTEGGKPVDPTEYRSLIGCLRYLLHTRPDLSYSVGLLSRFMQEPKEHHFKAIHQVLRYIKGTKDFGIIYKRNGGCEITGYSGSSYGVNTEEGKGTTGIVFYFGNSPITWCTQKQQTVALSSCESEFMAATAAVCQALWLKRLLSELTGWKEEKITLYVDNISAIALMKNPVFHGRSKHIDTRYHFIRECVENEDIIVEHISGELQKAEILTKALARVKFATMRELLGVQDLIIRD
ncbi:hypothetical protein E3N88_17746 [Mikania micrantha]|uniref:Integrase catalytic domain-containing protein n=1 Tax=Mikania micrantha TaxID=192012 RepID=A0A5N6NU62_9ASTR|nr:hypothetical protein E3N88_17746 [Mikania micrantha]